MSEYHQSPCNALQEHASIASESIESIMQELKEIKATCQEMKDMLEAWSNAKGFVATVKNVGKLLLWIVAIGAAYSAMTEAVKHWLAAK